MEVKIVIGGCRNYSDYSAFCIFVDECLVELGLEAEVTIVSGHCSGVDEMAERYAAERGFPVIVCPAEWAKYGRAAGPVRNRQMVEQSDAVIAFWDQTSKGTQSLIRYAKQQSKRLFIKYI